MNVIDSSQARHQLKIHLQAGPLTVEKSQPRQADVPSQAKHVYGKGPIETGGESETRQVPGPELLVWLFRALNVPGKRRAESIWVDDGEELLITITVLRCEEPPPPPPPPHAMWCH